MSERVKRLINFAATSIVDVVDRSAASDARLCVTGNHLNFPLWITVDTVEVPENREVSVINSVRDDSVFVPESELSSTRVRKFWAHTNDFDGEVYGWSAAELFVVNGDRQKTIDAIVHYLEQKLAGQERIDIKLIATAAPGCSQLPILVGDSDGGPEGVHQQSEFIGC